MSKRYHDKLLMGSGVSHRKFESDYAKKLMLQMGWKEGQGLGTKGTGVTECVQVARRKQQGSGLGIAGQTPDGKSEWSNNWWDDAYNSTISKIKIGTKPRSRNHSDSSDNSEESSYQTEKQKKHSKKAQTIKQRKMSKDQDSDDTPAQKELTLPRRHSPRLQATQAIKKKIVNAAKIMNNTNSQRNGTTTNTSSDSSDQLEACPKGKSRIKKSQ